MRIVIIIFLFFSSCSTKKDVLLFQDAKPGSEYKFNFKSIKIQSDDILKIKISSKAVDLTSLYNTDKQITGTNSIEGSQIEGYAVNQMGYVNIPTLGPVMVRGLNLTEAAERIQNLLKEEDVLKNATVDIKILNAYFTVIGEVNRPGRYGFLENNMDILQALGMAGDLTINGKREDIKIISKIDDNMKLSSVDLTSANLLFSDRFQIFPGDVIIVNANNARVKNAGVVGNFGNLLSVLSFILTSIVLISNN